MITPFIAQSTAAEVVHGLDLTDRRAIVTGGASGIGIETARALAGAGGEVTLAVRSLAAGERTARDIITTTGNEHVLAVPLDLADQASVASFTAGWDGPAWKTPEQGDEAELPANDARWLWPRARRPGRVNRGEAARARPAGPPRLRVPGSYPAARSHWSVSSQASNDTNGHPARAPSPRAVPPRPG